VCALVRADPTLVDLMDRHGIEGVPLLAPPLHHDDEGGRFEPREVLAHRLARQSQVCAELAQGLAVVRVQPVQQLPSARIGKRLEHRVDVLDHDLIISCKKKVTCQAQHGDGEVTFREWKPGFRASGLQLTAGPPRCKRSRILLLPLVDGGGVDLEWLGGISAIFQCPVNRLPSSKSLAYYWSA
jgi:hypothetical protein